MENNKKPLARLGGKVKQNWRKILIVLTFVLVLLSVIAAIACPNYQVGFKYENDTNELGICQIENFDALILRNYICKLQIEGYEVVSGKLDDSISCHWGIYKREFIKQKELEEELIKYINIEVAVYKLTIPDDEITYCFKNENECNDFVNKVKNYNSKLEVDIQKTIGKIEDISSEDILKEKLNKLEEIKQAEIARQKAAAAAKKKTATVSRSSYKRSNYSVIASYVYISSYYGMRHGKMHTGIDLASSSGTPVYAWKAGTVKQASWNSQGYGKFIIIEHDDGTTSRYAHLSGYAVSAGNTVTQGQLIGYVGSTGNSTGPHLHFEILVNGNFVNPLNYL